MINNHWRIEILNKDKVDKTIYFPNNNELDSSTFGLGRKTE
jgi:hypothetical protein